MTIWRMLNDRPHGGLARLLPMKRDGASVVCEASSEVEQTMAGALEQPIGTALSARPGGGARILVAEDEPATLRLILLLLRTAGYECEGVHDGETALERLRPGAYDLLVTDVRMRGMWGDRLAYEVWVGQPQFPILFLSGHSIGTVANLLDQREHARFLPKPFKPTELVDEVGSLLAIRNA
jgi:CheY-like chemotaxis protein